MLKMTLTALAALIATGAAAPAFAGECPAANVGDNALPGAATMPKGVTDNVLSTVDLGPEINAAERSLRMRRLVVQPGGVIPMHSHVDRPALIITVQGQMTEYRSTCKTPIIHRAGEVSREAGGLSHWWKNNGKTVAVLLSSDVHNDKK